MFALPPIATEGRTSRIGSEGPEREISARNNISGPALGTNREMALRALRRAKRHLAFASGFETVRMVLMNSSASELSVRFFRVATETVPRAYGKSTAKALSGRCLLDGSSVKRGA